MRIVKAAITGIVFTLFTVLIPDVSPIECSTFGMTITIWTWLVSGDKK